MKQTKTIGKRILKLLLVLTLCVFVTGCDEDSEGIWNSLNFGGNEITAPVIYSPKADRTLTVYEGENTILEIVMAADAAGTTPTTDNRGILFQWYRNGEEINNARGPVYELEDADMSDNGAVFYCTAGNTVATVTSAKFIIKVEPVLSDPIEDITKPTPTVKPTPTPTPHAHKWEPVMKDQDVYITVNVYGYKCNTCSFTATDEASMRAHLGENAGTDGHEVGSEAVAYTYKRYDCDGLFCTFFGVSQQELDEHISTYNHSMIPDEATGKYICTFTECNFELDPNASDFESKKSGHCIQHKAGETPTEVTVEGTDKLIYNYGCNGSECSELVFNTLADAEAHIESNPDHTFYEYVAGCQVPIYHCYDCFFTTTVKDELKNHYTNNTNETYEIVREATEGQSDGEYVCRGSCTSTTTTRAEANAHALANIENFLIPQYHTAGEDDWNWIVGYKCTVEGCDFETRDEEEITLHERETSGEHTCDFAQVLINSYQQHNGTTSVDTGLVYCAGCGQQRQRG